MMNGEGKKTVNDPYIVKCLRVARDGRVNGDRVFETNGVEVPGDVVNVVQERNFVTIYYKQKVVE